jgi:hypothetical protein
MSSIGQIRRNQISSYTNSVSYTLGTISNTVKIGSSTTKFTDPCIYSSVTAENSYYLRFKIKQRTDGVQDFTIVLSSEDTDTGNVTEQTVKSFSVPNGIEETVFELIFTPNAVYNRIELELQRETTDYKTEARLMDVEILAFQSINNIISTYLQSKFDGLKNLKKVGIQGPPGLLFTLNGEEMRIGRTGLYELYNENVTITYLGFVIKESNLVPDGKDFFILDFKY